MEAKFGQYNIKCKGVFALTLYLMESIYLKVLVLVYISIERSYLISLDFSLKIEFAL